MQDPRHVVEGREHDQEILGGGGGGKLLLVTLGGSMV
jgi:hypothetical protein